MTTILANAVSLDVGAILFGTLGGLGLFLYGMHKMSDGLQAVAGDSMKTLLSKLTTNRFTAAITGAVVTAVLQSSSITTVLVVGFVSAGLMTLTQTVGIIMGANVGTTVTAQMLAFDITDWAWAMIGLGFLSWSFARRDVLRDVGTMLMGFGMLFIGMGQMGDATSPLRTHQPFIDLMASMDRVLLGMLIGAAFTALVQSSSATIGIVIMLATQGHLTLEAGIAISISAKVGTCVTAVLAGLGKPAEARRVGIVHVLFNLLGAFLWLPFIDQLAAMATAVSPTFENLQGTERLAEETPRQVANAITIFASINLAVMIWFTGPIAKLAEKLVPSREEREPRPIEPKYLDPVFLRTPAVAVDQVRLELGHLADRVTEMLEKGPVAVVQGTSEDLDHIAAMDEDVDRLHAGILRFIGELAREELKTSETRRLERAVDIANNLEAIGDLIKMNLVAQGRKRLQRNLRVFDPGSDAGRSYYDGIGKAMADTRRAIVEDDPDLAREVISRKEAMRSLAAEAGEEALKGLTGEPDGVDRFRIESDIINQVIRIFYHVRRIAKAVAGVTDDSENGEAPPADTHEEI